MDESSKELGRQNNVYAYLQTKDLKGQKYLIFLNISFIRADFYLLRRQTKKCL